MVFRNYLTNEPGELVPAWERSFTPDELEELLNTVTEPGIMQLFHGYFTDGKLTLEGLRRYLAYAVRAHATESNQVFFVVNSHGQIVGSIDLQREDAESCSLGFWASSRHRGYMTNALRCLLDNVHSFGYSTVNAYTSVANSKAVKLLERMNFRVVGVIETKNLTKFTRDLEAASRS